MNHDTQDLDKTTWSPVCSLDDIVPNSLAGVLSRGLVGCLGGRIVVASPIYKHPFDLRSGECLEAPEHSVNAYPVRVQDR